VSLSSLLGSFRGKIAKANRGVCLKVKVEERVDSATSRLER
jgi:hypothetical protein